MRPDPGIGALVRHSIAVIAALVCSSSWIVIATSARAAEPTGEAPGLYRERYRPQFHFTAKKNWLNDPNGLVFYKGEYHLFFQHNPKGIRWGNMTWGHAVSPDMVHWTQLEHALYPDSLGMCFSGSAVIDWNNTAGFKTGDEDVMVAVYTSHGRSEQQSLAYSNDRGRTWTKYEGNPVLTDKDRDPKVMWHEPTKKWVMVLFRERGISFYSSPNLKKWTLMSSLKGFHECPDMFELAVDGETENTRWVLHDGRPWNVLIGDFDGEKFVPEPGKMPLDRGKNFYAAQTFSDMPKRDGRRIQIAWLRGGKYPGMPFNQQMGFPCVLTLRTFPEGIRLCRQPVKEIEVLRTREHRFANVTLGPGENLLDGISGELFEVQAEIEPAGASGFGIRARGETVHYDFGKKQLTALGRTAPLAPIENRVKLHILVDRATLEVFGNDGKVSMSSCFLQDDPNRSLEVYATDGNVKVIGLTVYELKSAWPEPGAGRKGE